VASIQSPSVITQPSIYRERSSSNSERSEECIETIESCDTPPFGGYPATGTREIILLLSKFASNSKIDFQYSITSYCLSFLIQNQYFDKGNLLAFTDNNDL